MMYQGLIMAVCFTLCYGFGQPGYGSSHGSGGYETAQLYHGRYQGRCDADGFYYKDTGTFMMCSNGNAYEHRCAPGSRNSDFSTYGNGFRGFCNVNLVDYGYTLRHGKNSGYGKGNTGYGSQNTGYGSQSTGYGSQSTGYGHQATGYGAQTTGYGQPTTGYGHQATGYGNQNTGYGHQGGYGGQSSGYGYQSTGYGHQNTGYGNQNRGHGAGFGSFGRGRGFGGQGYGNNQGYGYVETYQRYEAPQTGYPSH